MLCLFLAYFCLGVTYCALRIAVLADIHFDERYSSTGSSDVFCREDQGKSVEKYSLPGCDTSEALLDSAIASLKVDGPFDCIVVLGDTGPHSSLSVEMVQRATEVVAKKLRTVMEVGQAEAHTIILPVVGNNDVFPTYHVKLEDEDPQIAFIADAYKYAMPSDAAAHFRAKSFYSVHMHEDKITFVVINTNYYSRRHTNMGIDPMKQFQWLGTELEKARKNQYSVILIGHIPFGVNSYDESEALHSEYTAHLRSLLRRYASIILFSLHGHYHSSYPFTLTVGEEPLISMFLCPSIAPSNYNNPGFYVFHVLDNHTVDYEHLSLSIEVANAQARNGKEENNITLFSHLYQFSQRYAPWLGSRALPTPRNIARLYQMMQQDDFLWNKVHVAAISMLSTRRSEFVESWQVMERQ